MSVRLDNGRCQNTWRRILCERIFISLSVSESLRSSDNKSPRIHLIVIDIKFKNETPTSCSRLRSDAGKLYHNPGTGWMRMAAVQVRWLIFPRCAFYWLRGFCVVFFLCPGWCQLASISPNTWRILSCKLKKQINTLKRHWCRKEAL